MTWSATISAVSPGAGTPTGTVSFLDGTTTVATATLVSGAASFTTVGLTVGSHSLTVAYAGDGNFTASTSSAVTQTVSKAASAASVVTDSPNPSVFGQTVTLSATVSATSPGDGTPTGTVTFLDGATTLGTATLAGGSAGFTTAALTLDNNSVTVTYAGDGNFTGNTSSAVTHTVNQAASTVALAPSVNLSVFGQTVTLVASVSAAAPGAGTPTGTVTFLDGTSTLGMAMLAGGSASFSTAGLSLGSHSITVSYSGDGNFTGSTSGAVTQTVDQAGSVVAVTPSDNPSVFGQPVTFSASVTSAAPGSGTPTGTVTFLDGSTTLGTATLASGAANVTTAGLAVGSHSITISYTGDTNYTASTSATLTDVVKHASTITLSASGPDPSLIGQAVTLQATVSAVAPGAGTRPAR